MAPRGGVKLPRDMKDRNERFVLNVLQGFDMERVKFKWAGCLGYLVRTGVAAVWMDEDKREITIDWRLANAEQIGDGMRELKSQPEWGGEFSICDLEESKRVVATHKEMEAHRAMRAEKQREDEALEKLNLLQPKVSSLEGVYGAAELGNVHVLDALIKGYPLPKYDPKTGKMVPNPDRLAAPENKTVVRVPRQLAHHPTDVQFRHMTAKPAGDPMDDLRLAAPHIFSDLSKGGVIQGTSYDLRDASGRTPLHFAAAAGKVEALEMLLDNGSDPNALDRDGLTPLHHAGLGGHTECLDRLLRKGGRFDIVSINGRNALHSVCTGGHAETVKALMFEKRFAAYKPWEMMHTRTIDFDESILHYLCRSPFRTKEEVENSCSTLRFLVKAWLQFCFKSPPELVEVIDKNGKTVLHLCAALGNSELGKYFCSFGAKVNHACHNGDLAAHIAVRNGNINLLTSLIASGTNMGHANNEGDTPLHIAATVGIMDLFKMCYTGFPQTHGKKPWVWLNGRGESAAHIVSRLSGPPPAEPDGRKGNDFFEMTRFSVNNGADASQLRSSLGNTLFICAAQGGGVKAMEFMIKFTLDQEGNTPVLTTLNDMKESAMMIAARHGRTEVVLNLINKHGCDPRHRSRNGLNALSEAAAAGMVDTTLALLPYAEEEGDILGRSALHWAAKGGHEAVVSAVCQLDGMDLSVGDRGGETPLHISSSMGHCASMNVLLYAGADPKATNKRGETAADLAGSEEARLLLEKWQAAFGDVSPVELVYLRAAVTGVMGNMVESSILAAFGPKQENNVAEEEEVEEDWKASVGSYSSMMQSRKGKGFSSLRTKSSGSGKIGRTSSLRRYGSTEEEIDPESPGSPSMRRSRTAKSVRFGDGEGEEDDPSTAWPGSEAWGGLDASPFPPSNSRPQTVYTALGRDGEGSGGRPISAPWFLPPRPKTISYTKESPRLRPRRQAAYRGTGSALDLQMLKVDWASNSPFARMRPPSTAATQEEAHGEIASTFGSSRGTDRGWSSLHGSSFWDEETNPKLGARAQRKHVVELRNMRPYTSGDAPRPQIINNGPVPEPTWLPPIAVERYHMSSPLKRPSTVDPALLRDSVEWRYDELIPEKPLVDGDWVKHKEVPIPKEAEMNKFKAQSERARAEELHRIIMMDEEEDPWTVEATKLPPIKQRPAGADEGDPRVKYGSKKLAPWMQADLLAEDAASRGGGYFDADGKWVPGKGGDGGIVWGADGEVAVDPVTGLPYQHPGSLDKDGKKKKKKADRRRSLWIKDDPMVAARKQAERKAWEEAQQHAERDSDVRVERFLNSRGEVVADEKSEARAFYDRGEGAKERRRSSVGEFAPYRSELHPVYDVLGLEVSKRRDSLDTSDATEGENAGKEQDGDGEAEEQTDVRATWEYMPSVVTWHFSMGGPPAVEVDEEEEYLKFRRATTPPPFGTRGLVVVGEEKEGGSKKEETDTETEGKGKEKDGTEEGKHPGDAAEGERRDDVDVGGEEEAVKMLEAREAGGVGAGNAPKKAGASGDDAGRT